jgi:hypothetical protein
MTPFSNVAYYVFGDSVAGYDRLMRYATDRYRVEPAFPYTINVAWEYPASYRRGDGKLYIGRKAFTKNVLYLVSAYIHEYVHSLQYWISTWKSERETEAYCIQIDWIKARPLLPQAFEISKETLLEDLENAFKEDLGRTLDCTGEFPRAEIRAKVDAMNKQSPDGSIGAGKGNLRSSSEGETHAPESQEWENVIE